MSLRENQFAALAEEEEEEEEEEEKEEEMTTTTKDSGGDRQPTSRRKKRKRSPPAAAESSSESAPTMVVAPWIFVGIVIGGVIAGMIGGIVRNPPRRIDPPPGLPGRAPVPPTPSLSKYQVPPTFIPTMLTPNLRYHISPGTKPPERKGIQPHRGKQLQCSFYGRCFTCRCLGHSQKWCPLKRCSHCREWGHSDLVCSKKTREGPEHSSSFSS